MYLVIDIGGTKTLLSSFKNLSDPPVDNIRFSTSQNLKLFIYDLKVAISNLNGIKERRIIPTLNYQDIAIAVPGPVQDNKPLYFGNLEWLADNFINEMKNLLGNSKYVIENDATLGAIYESSQKKGKTIYLTFSTGIGGGIVRNNQVVNSSSVFEPGHYRYLFNQKWQEWEDFCAASSLRQLYGHTDFIKVDWDNQKLRDLAIRISIGLIPLIKQYQPDHIIFGGPLKIVFPEFISYLLSELNQKGVEITQMLPSPDRHMSVIYGGAMLLSERSL